MRERGGGREQRQEGGARARAGGRYSGVCTTCVGRVRVHPGPGGWIPLGSPRFPSVPVGSPEGALPRAPGSYCWRRETSSLRRRDKIRADAEAPYMGSGDIADGRGGEKVG